MFTITLEQVKNEWDPGEPDRIAKAIVTRGVERARSVLRALTPVDRGDLLDAVLYTEWPTRWGGGWRAGVGDIERLGDPSQPAPGGTISAFLDWYRGYGAGDADGRKVRRPRTRTPGWSPRYRRTGREPAWKRHGYPSKRAYDNYRRRMYRKWS